MQPVRPDQPPAAHFGRPAVPAKARPHARRAGYESGHGSRQHARTDISRARGQRTLQHGAANATPRSGAEARVGGRTARRRQVPDAGERPPRRVDPQRLQPAQPDRDKSLPAGLVDGLAARRVEPGIRDQHVEARGRGEHADRQADRPGTRHEQVGVHARQPAAAATAPVGLPGARRPSAASSQRIRAASNGASSTVNAVAVSQAVCTSGSARPSTATAR